MRRPHTVRCLVVAIACLAAMTCVPVAEAGTAWRNCDAMIVEDGRVEILPSGYIINGAPERGGFPRASTAFFIQVRGRRCPGAWTLVQRVLTSSDESAAFTGLGYRLLSTTDFAGRVSGADGNCGEILRFQKVGGQRLICARTRARQGDSGGSVYLRPVNGRTRAVGIVKGSRLNFPPLARGELCYTPIEKILETFNATLPRGQI